MTRFHFSNVIPFFRHKPKPATKIPVKDLWQVAALSAHGFRVKIYGNRAWMVKP